MSPLFQFVLYFSDIICYSCIPTQASVSIDTPIGRFVADQMRTLAEVATRVAMGAAVEVMYTRLWRMAHGEEDAGEEEHDAGPFELMEAGIARIEEVRRQFVEEQEEAHDERQADEIEALRALEAEMLQEVQVGSQTPGMHNCLMIVLERHPTLTDLQPQTEITVERSLPTKPPS